MYRTKTLFVFLLAAGYTCIHAQNNTVPSGGSATGVGGTVTYSVGQIDYQYQFGGNGNLNQGLQQPYEFFSMGGEDQAIQLSLSVYPNPTTHVLNLSIDKSDLNGFSYGLFNMNGEELLNSAIVNKISQIDMEFFPASSYVLTIFNNKTKIQSFTIIKK